MASVKSSLVSVGWTEQLEDRRDVEAEKTE